MKHNMQSVLACMEAADRFLQEDAVQAELAADAVLGARLRHQAESLARTIRLATRRPLGVLLCPACGEQLRAHFEGADFCIECPSKCSWTPEQGLTVRYAMLGREGP